MDAEQLAAAAEIRKLAGKALKHAGQDGVSLVDLSQVEAAVGLSKAGLYSEEVELPDAFRRLLGKASSKLLGLLAIPEKRIYVDQSLSYDRGRFTEAHEIGHEVIPWHEGAFYHDDSVSLSTSTRDALEKEANTFASELLMGAGRFTGVADDYAPGLSVPLMLGPQFGVSAAATIRYYVEWSKHPVAVIGMSQYETPSRAGLGIHVIPAQSFASSSFLKRYGRVEDMFPGGVITPANGAYHLAMESKAVGTGATATVSVNSTRGVVTMHAELFNNNRLRYLVLSHSTRFSGRRLEVVGPTGELLFRAL